MENEIHLRLPGPAERELQFAIKAGETYKRHCGKQAAKMVEDDLLGELIAVVQQLQSAIVKGGNISELEYIAYEAAANTLQKIAE